VSQARSLGEILVRDKIITAEEFAKALASLKEGKGSLVDALVRGQIADEQLLLEFFSKKYRLPIMDLSSFKPDSETINLVPPNLCIKHSCLPVGRRGDTLVIAVSDPTNIQLLDDIRFQVRLRVEQVLSLHSVLKSVVESQYGQDVSKLVQGMEVEVAPQDAPQEGEMKDDDAPIIQYVQNVLADAVKKRASDIHIEPFEKELRVRFRIDGDLTETVKPPNAVKSALLARVKVMSKMRLDEKRLPQDGRIRIKTSDGKVIDFRVNTLPTVYGEKICLRILDKSNAVVSMDKVGFEKDDLAKFMKAVREPWGMCLVTGATGSGKTTTLYAALNELNTPDVNISTIEDPVEYNFHGINQVQVKEQIGLTFATTLRALLRQDPDVILLGEIRDAETAEIAFKAALTGHMVLSTLHTNDAPATVMRLKDMGVDSFLINSALHVVVAQKLVRRICPDCKAPDQRTTPDKLKALGFPSSSIGKFTPMVGQGCKTCRNTGFKGRAAIQEVMMLTDKLKELIGANCSTEELRKGAVAEGMKTLKFNCMRKIVAGICSIDELQAVGGGH
jgi:type IV pilus assembly protein PilB